MRVVGDSGVGDRVRSYFLRRSIFLLGIVMLGCLHMYRIIATHMWYMQRARTVSRISVLKQLEHRFLPYAVI